MTLKPWLLLCALALLAVGGCSSGTSEQPPADAKSVLLSASQASDIGVQVSAVQDTILSVPSTSSISASMAPGKTLLLPPGTDPRFPLGFAGKVSSVETRADGSKLVTLAAATLADAVQSSKISQAAVALGAENFVGVLSPAAVKPAPGAKVSASQLRGDVSALGGALVVRPANPNFLRRALSSVLPGGGTIDAGSIQLNVELQAAEIVDNPSLLKPYGSGANAKIGLSLKLDNLKLTENHEFGSSVAGLPIGLKSLDLHVEGDLSADLKFVGGAEARLGFFSRAWKEVEDQSVSLLGVSAKLTGLDSKDKVGKFPIAGLVFSLPCTATVGCPIQTGTTQTPLRAAKAGGVIVWIYLMADGTIKVDGTVGLARVNNLHFLAGMQMPEGGNLDKTAAFSHSSVGNVVDAPYYEGTVDVTWRSGIAIDVDFFAFGIRIANTSAAVLNQATLALTGSVAHSWPALTSPWVWTGSACASAQVDAGLMVAASFNLGAEVNTPFGKASGGFAYFGQWPSDAEIATPGWYGIPIGSFGTWYSAAPLTACWPAPVASSVAATAAGNTVTIAVSGTNLPDDLSLILTNPGSCAGLHLLASGGNLVTYACTLPAGGTGALNYQLTSAKAGNLDTSALSGSIVLAPVISAHPQGTSVVSGQPAAFTVAASGASLSYEWRKGSAASGVPAPGATNSPTYTIASTALADNGSSYFVIVRNSAGFSTSNPATLTVTNTTVPPSLMTQPRDVSVNVGQSAAFSVTATGTTPRYEWRKGNATSSVLAPGATDSPTYTIPSAVLTDNGSTYFVIARNSAGVASSSLATLTVTAAMIAPAITTQPRAVTVNVGQLAAFSVAATGINLSYAWRKGNATSSVAAPGATNGPSYTTPATTLADNGSTYFVIIGNSAGSVNSSPASLTILPATSGNTQAVMTATPDPVRPGEYVQYAVTVTNSGTNGANFTLNAQVPNHTTVPAGSIGQSGGCVGASSGACPSGGTLSWIFNNIPAGQSFTAQFAALVNTTNPPPNGTVIRSTAAASGSYGGATAGVDVVVSTADLSMGMVNAPSTVFPGGALTYTLRFGNPGATSSQAAVLSASLPPGTAFATASDGGTVVGGMVQWNVGALAPGAAGQRQLVVLVNPLMSNGSVVNATADLRDASTGRSLARANAAATVLTNSNTQAVMTATPDPVRPGEYVQYAVTVTNSGTNGANFTLNAQVPNHTTVPAGSIGQSGGCNGVTNGACPSGGTLSWIFNNIPAGQSFTAQFAALVNTTNPPPNGTVIRSTAAASGSYGGATAGVDVVVSTADLSMGMVNAPSTVFPGGALTYTLRFGNPGGTSSTAAVLSASLPPGTAFATASDGGTVVNGMVQWNVGALAPGAAGQRQLVVLVDTLMSNGSVVNATAELRDANTGRSLARANAAAAVLTNGNTQMVMTAAPDPVRPGEYVQYAVTVTNRSANGANFTLTAQVPNHTTVPAGSTGQSGFCNGVTNGACPTGGTLRWIFNSIPAGQSFTAQFAALVDTTNPPPNGTVIRSTAAASGSYGGATAGVDVVVSF